MKFLIDNALSPLVADGLAQAGYDAAHVREFGQQDAVDSVLLRLAQAESRILVSGDTDFGTLLALWAESSPSVILLRREVSRRPDYQTGLLLRAIPLVTQELGDGSIVVIEPKRIRIRRLPIGG